MVNISTLYYVLENLENKSDDLFNLDELLELENSQVQNLFEIIDQNIGDVRPEIIKRILQTANTL